MEVLLTRITQQAMNYAIRSGIAITTSYALRHSARLLQSTEDSTDRAELQRLQEQLAAKIRILGPAIDMIELISARGNSSLETAVSLTKSLRYEIQTLGQEIAEAANAEEASNQKTATPESKAGRQKQLVQIVSSIKRLLSSVEEAIPLINLAITTSGASLTTALPPSISPSRLLQASTFVTAGDTQYAVTDRAYVQIGPTFTLSLYMLFAGHVRPTSEVDIRQTTWKEVIHKARVKLVRVPLDELYQMPDPTGRSLPPKDRSPGNMAGLNRSDEFAYQVLIIEDLDDGRVHTVEHNEPKPRPYDDVKKAGIREILPIHEISKIFYADTGKILNIGDEVEANSPVLLLRRDLRAVQPRRMLERQELSELLKSNYDDDQATIDAQLEHEWRANSQALDDEPPSPTLSPPPTPPPPDIVRSIPPDLDPEWMAFEVFVDDPESDSESEDGLERTSYPMPKPGAPVSTSGSEPGPRSSVEPALNKTMSHLKLNTPSPASSHITSPAGPSPLTKEAASPDTHLALHSLSQLALPNIRTSLSLLETMLRLLSLQQFQQTSHLSIPDELLSFFLSEATSTTGAAGGDDVQRRLLRQDARMRVGFDPYDESPIKRRGEEYQRYSGGASHADEDEDGAYTPAQARASTTPWAPAGWSSSPPPLSPGQHTAIDEGYGTQQLSSRPGSAMGTAGQGDFSAAGYAAGYTVEPQRTRMERLIATYSPNAGAPLRVPARNSRRKGSPLAQVDKPKYPP